MSQVARWIWLVALGLAIGTLAARAAEPAPMRQALTVGPLERHYWTQRPPAAEAPLPTVILLHGANQDPIGFAAETGWTELARRAGFALVVPETLDGHWNDGRKTVYFGTPSMGDDETFLDGMMRALVEGAIARADAIYLAGFSNGGLMALRLACRDGGIRPAGIIIAAATLGVATAERCRPPVPLATILAVGTADALFPYGGGTGMVNGRSGEPTLAAAATVDLFARANGCGARKTMAASAEAMGRGSAVSVEAFAACPEGGPVLLVTVIGGGHEWPPGNVEALGRAAGADGPLSLAELAWAAFARGAPAAP